MVNIKEIMNLISLKKEGSYWDFKRNWYEKGNEGDLLIDIINMANNLVDRDAYIIIGVDEENNYRPYSLQDDPGRKTTQNLVDFLRSKKFAGDCRPIVEVEHCTICGYVLDVIVIRNSENTPFYLNRDYKQVHAYNIYVRIEDSNTPSDSSADICHVEYLWKKRFGLLKTPLQRIQDFLSDKCGWKTLPGNDECLYYKQAPEYTIGYPLEDPYNRNGYEFYLLNQTDSTPHWTVIQLKYNQTILKEMSGVILDGGRHFSPCPLHDIVNIDKSCRHRVDYKYWVEESLEYAVHLFYFKGNDLDAEYSERMLMENILVFEDEQEHKHFNDYIIKNWSLKEIPKEELENISIPENIPANSVEKFKEQIITASVLKKMLLKYRWIQQKANLGKSN